MNIFRQARSSWVIRVVMGTSGVGAKRPLILMGHRRTRWLAAGFLPMDWTGAPKKRSFPA
jgi:hypothetical protein